MDELIAQGLAYMRATWRRRWYALLIAWVIAIVGWGWVYSLPNVYKASARVYVDTKSLLDPLLRGLTVEPNVEQRVDMVTRTLLSRPNLQEVARRSDLDLSAKTPAKMQALVDDLGKSISLQGGNRDNIYTISYEYKKPAVARKVVQSLLNIFMETSVGGTREDIDSSQQFIDKQLQAYKQKLDAQEEKIKNFKQNNYGLLPGQGGDYFDRLQQAKSDLDQARLQLKEAENRKSVLEARLNGKQPVLLGSPNSSSSQSDSTGELRCPNCQAASATGPIAHALYGQSPGREINAAYDRRSQETARRPAEGHGCWRQSWAVRRCLPGAVERIRCPGGKRRGFAQCPRIRL